MLTHEFQASDPSLLPLRGTGLQMGHLEDAFTLRLTVILQGPQAVCVNMISVCVCLLGHSADILQHAHICQHQQTNTQRDHHD